MLDIPGGPSFEGMPTPPDAGTDWGVVTSFNTRMGAIVLTDDDITAAGGALLAGPQSYTGVHTFEELAGQFRGTVQTTGAMLVNANTGTPEEAWAGLLQLVGPDNQGTFIYLDTYHGNPGIIGRHTGGTKAAPAALPAQATLLSFDGQGWNGTYMLTGAVFRMGAQTVWTATSHPTYFEWFNAAANAPDVTCTMQLSAAGRLLLGTKATAGIPTDPGPVLDVGGAARISVAPGVAWLTVNGNTAATTPTPPVNVMLQITGLDATSTRINLDAFGATPGNFISFRRAGATAAAPATIPTNSTIGGLQWFGHDGTGYTVSPRASVTAVTPTTGGAWSGTSHPTILQFQVTATNSTTMAEAMRIAPSGNVLIGTTTDGVFKLDVAGAGRVTGDFVIGGKSGFNGTTPIAKRTGWGAPTGTATRTTFATGSVTLPVLAEHVKALIDDMTAYGLIGA